jgi:hypothetical protein
MSPPGEQVVDDAVDGEKSLGLRMKQGLLHDLLTRGVDEHGDLRPLPEDAPRTSTRTRRGGGFRRGDAVTMAAWFEGSAG